MQVEEQLSDLKVEHSESQNAKQEVKSAWVTFSKMEDKDKAMEMMNQTAVHRVLFLLFNWGCFRRYFERWPSYYNGSLLRASSTTDPSNILWTNLMKTPKEAFLRRFISWVIFVVLIVANLVFLVMHIRRRAAIQ